ncbi:hypothetical protein ABZ725_42580 [Streptomyces sp. NPDC006872]|uniref:hypothetical protein n=1 Tax=Streptomyces sp. NPDC006872 TaxID=3155720 RepID=UPI0034065E4C
MRRGPLLDGKARGRWSSGRDGQPCPASHDLALLAALVALAAIVLTALAPDAGDELTEHQDRVLCAAL